MAQKEYNRIKRILEDLHILYSRLDFDNVEVQTLKRAITELYNFNSELVESEQYKKEYGESFE